MSKCPQCGYERNPVDDQYMPLTECPRCGSVYPREHSRDPAPESEGGRGEAIPQEQSPLHVEYVGFWPRVAATVIDSLLLFMAAFFIAGIMTLAYPFLPSPREPLGNFLLTFFFPAVATLAFWFRYLATPGKMAIAAIIVDARTGDIPSKGQFVGRYLAYTLSGLCLGLGFLWVAFDPRKQGWHDKLAGTVVVRKPRSLAVRY